MLPVTRPLVRLLLCTTVPALIAGCPIPQTPPGDQPQSPGIYWAEYRDGELALLELPRYRGEPGVWHTLGPDLPEWYVGPGLYLLSDDGLWSRLTTDQTVTLDEVIQLHDPPPRIGAFNILMHESAAHERARSASDGSPAAGASPSLALGARSPVAGSCMAI